MSSLLVLCACCSKPVVTKNKSKERTCSHNCYMKLYRKRLKAKALEDNALNAEALKVKKMAEALTKKFAIANKIEQLFGADCASQFLASVYTNPTPTI